MPPFFGRLCSSLRPCHRLPMLFAAGASMATTSLTPLPRHLRRSSALLLDFQMNPRMPVFRTVFCAVRPSGFHSTTLVSAPDSVDVARYDEDKAHSERLEVLRMKLLAQGIDCGHLKPGQYPKMICPECDGGSQYEKSFSLFVREDAQLALWLCFRAKCGWKGVAQVSQTGNYPKAGIDRAPRARNYRKISEQDLNLEPLGQELKDYFAERNISVETLRRNGVMQQCCGDQVIIAFTYRRDAELISCKYRGANKLFWQETDTERILYGLDDIKNAQDVIIVEGEIDKLSMEEAGFLNCVSVPNGAPPHVSENIPDEEKDTRFQFLWNCKVHLEKASRIILATDADLPGQALAEEIARRLGKERCWRVSWPMKNETEVCKDANEVLMYLGQGALKEVVEKAELYPIRGLFSFSDFNSEIDNYYICGHSSDFAVSTGWNNVDQFYKIVPGELTVVTGVPNSGKSEWIDALLCNINEIEKWKFVLCSMENKVRDHARKLLEKHIKKPFFGGPRYAGDSQRMSMEELENGKRWLNDSFHLIRCDDDCLPSIDWVLTLAKAAVLRYGVRGLIIDPYNELDHQRSSYQSETEYVSQMLTKIKRFAQHYSCHVWFVAHPRQLHNWTGDAPNLYDISGSAHFINKCDNGIVIHRNRDPNTGPLDLVQVCVRKVRNKVAGGLGEAFLTYDCITGEYREYQNPATLEETD